MHWTKSCVVAAEARMEEGARDKVQSISMNTMLLSVDLSTSL